MRAVLLAAMLAAVVLAGCSHRDPGGGPSGTSSMTGTGPEPRTAALSAGIVNGSAPLRVDFSIQATGGPQSWSLAFGDGNTTNGTTVPAAVNHTFEGSGLFRVDLSVAYPDGASLLRNVTVNVTAGGPAQIPFNVEGTIVFGTQGDEGCGVTESGDIAQHAWDLSEAVVGTGRIAKIVAHMDLGDGNLDSDLYLHDPSGAEIGASEDSNQPGIGSGSPTEDFEVEGPLAPGIYTFLVRGCVAAGGDYRITATADIEA